MTRMLEEWKKWWREPILTSGRRLGRPKRHLSSSMRSEVDEMSPVGPKHSNQWMKK